MSKNNVEKSDNLTPPRPIESHHSSQDLTPLPPSPEPQNIKSDSKISPLAEEMSKDLSETGKNFSGNPEKNFLKNTEIPVIGQIDPLHDPKRIQERVEVFNNDLRSLLKKYNLQLQGEPVIYKGLILARPVVSEYVEEEKK